MKKETKNKKMPDAGNAEQIKVYQPLEESQRIDRRRHGLKKNTLPSDLITNCNQKKKHQARHCSCGSAQLFKSVPRKVRPQVFARLIRNDFNIDRKFCRRTAVTIQPIRNMRTLDVAGLGVFFQQLIQATNQGINPARQLDRSQQRVMSCFVLNVHTTDNNNCYGLVNNKCYLSGLVFEASFRS